MNNDSLLSPANIAELASVSRPVVSNWRRRNDDFPEPVGGTDARPLFSHEDIITWLTNRNHKIKTGDTVAAVWASVNTLRGQLSSDDVETLVLLLLATRQYLPDTFEDIEEADEKSRITLLETAEEALRLKYPVNEEAREDLRVPIRKHLESIEAADLSPIISAVSSADTAQIPDYTDKLIERFNRSQGRMGGTHGTIDSRASQLLVALACNTEGTVYDPASGIADALIQVARERKATKLVGSEIDSRAVTIACLRTLLSGTNISYALGDVLESDPVPGLEADTIIAELPFGLSVDTTSMISDPRFSYGVPTRRGSELLWIQHALTHLAPGGRAYLLTTQSALQGGRTEQLIRSKLLREGCIDTIVALPDRMLRHTAIGLALWVVKNPDPESSTVLMVDASEIQDPVAAIPAWLNQDSHPTISAPHTNVDISDIISEDSILTPARWVGAIDVDPEVVKSDLLTASTGLNESIRSLAETKLSLESLATMPAARIASLSELFEKGILERIMYRGRSSDLPDDPSIITHKHIRNQELPDVAQQQLPELGEKIGMVETEPGDILVSTGPGTHVLIDTTGGHRFSFGIDNIRIKDTSVITRDYLAHTLQGEWNERFRTGGALRRVPLHDLEIPLIPVEDQKKIGELLRQLRLLQGQARSLIEHSSQLASTALDTIRHGVPITEADIN